MVGIARNGSVYAHGCENVAMSSRVGAQLANQRVLAKWRKSAVLLSRGRGRYSPTAPSVNEAGGRACPTLSPLRIHRFNKRVITAGIM